jgi:hypothetical protein
MTSKQWRDIGYHTIFHGDRVWLYQMNQYLGLSVSAEIDGGRWMESESLDDPIWEVRGIDRPGTPDLVAIATNCYCDQGVGTCDYCSGIRFPSCWSADPLKSVGR